MVTVQKTVHALVGIVAYIDNLTAFAVRDFLITNVHHEILFDRIVDGIVVQSVGQNEVITMVKYVQKFANLAGLHFDNKWTVWILCK